MTADETCRSEWVNVYTDWSYPTPVRASLMSNLTSPADLVRGPTLCGAQTAFGRHNG
jgi:hypothetical protein